VLGVLFLVSVTKSSSVVEWRYARYIADGHWMLHTRRFEMKFEDLLFSRRIRQNHALEHATITILSGMVSTLNVSARSSSDGFVIFGDVDLGLLRRALDEALTRLKAGEAELAIHPNCGTNLAVGVSMVTIGSHSPELWHKSRCRRVYGDDWNLTGDDIKPDAYTCCIGSCILGRWLDGGTTAGRICAAPLYHSA
jgi:hypothetical protein